MRRYIKADIIDIMDDEYVTRLAAASDPNTRPAVLIRLAQDPAQQVRLHVSFNVNAPAEALAILAKDSDAYVRRGVAENANTSTETLDKLVYDPSDFVFTGVAGNPNTSVNALKYLFDYLDHDGFGSDEEKYILSAIYHNPSAVDWMRTEALSRLEDWDYKRTRIDIYFNESELQFGFNRGDIERAATHIIEDAGYNVYSSGYWPIDEDDDFQDAIWIQCDLLSVHRDSRMIEHKIYQMLESYGARNMGYEDEIEECA